MTEKKEKFTWEKDEVTARSSKVGQAVYDILSKPQESQDVGETISEYSKDYVEMMKKTVETGKLKYEAPFYVVVLTKKEPWALNVMRNWFVARQTAPSARDLRYQYPNYMHTVYQILPTELKILWSLPIHQDAEVVLKNPHLYHNDLVQWIRDFYFGRLERYAA